MELSRKQINELITGVQLSTEIPSSSPELRHFVSVRGYIETERGIELPDKNISENKIETTVFWIRDYEVSKEYIENDWELPDEQILNYIYIKGIVGIENPAAVCVMDKWPEEESMMKLAMENNLSETAFIVKEEHGYHLRWFTPASEVELCGHATLASSFILFNYFERDKDVIEFDTKSGKLTVIRRDNQYEMDFPICEQHEIPVTDDMESAFGVRPVKALLGTDLICIFDSEELIREMNPDQSILAQLPGRGQSVTAKGTDVDCVSRSFFPKLSVPEDPVCGSAHCQIADYWSQELGKNTIISISGEATLVAISELAVDF